MKIYKRDDFKENLYSELIKNRMLNELFHESVPVIYEDDMNSLMHSIENRSPLNTELVKHTVLRRK